MARQARSKVTRRRIIDAAVELFSERGYAATGLGDIIERVDMTKGALYYHFDSKESLACAIVDESASTIFTAFETGSVSPTPALENMIHSAFVVADLFRTDKLTRIGAQLARALGDSVEAASGAYRRCETAMSGEAARAQVQKDLRPDLDPDAVGELIIAALLGAELISAPTAGGNDLIDRLTRIWEVLLPAIVTEPSVPYFQEFLARESMRHRQPALLL